MKRIRAAITAIAAFALGIALPHIPECDAKLILNMLFGLLVGLTIRWIWTMPTAKKTPLLIEAIN